MNFTKSKKLFFLIVAVNVFLLIVIIFEMVFILKKNNDLTNLKKQYIEENARQAEVSSLKSLVNDTKNERDYLLGLFVDKDKIIDFLEFIESLGKVSGARVKVISVSEEKGVPSSGFSSIKFEADGSWIQVYKMVSLIDHISAAFLVKALEISKVDPDSGGKGEKVGPWRVTVDAKVFKLI